MNVAFLHRKPVRLIDGSLVDGRRASLVSRMTADLVEGDAFECEDDAIVHLAFKGYRLVDIFMLLDDVRQAARQVVVAKEMGAP